MQAQIFRFLQLGVVGDGGELSAQDVGVKKLEFQDNVGMCCFVKGSILVVAVRYGCSSYGSCFLMNVINDLMGSIGDSGVGLDWIHVNLMQPDMVDRNYNDKLGSKWKIEGFFALLYVLCYL